MDRDCGFHLGRGEIFFLCDFKLTVCVVAKGREEDRFPQVLSAVWASVGTGLLLPSSPAAPVWWSFGTLFHRQELMALEEAKVSFVTFLFLVMSLLPFLFH